MALTSDDGAAVVCGVLCFAQNKMGYLPVDKLQEVLVRGFGEVEIERGKELVFEAAGKFPELKSIRKKARKNTGHKKKAEADVEDILEVLYAADRLKIDLQRFAVVYINVFPHVPLEEVDGSVVCEKVVSKLSSGLEEVLKGIVEEAQSASCDSAAAIFGKLSSEMTTEIEGDIKKLSEEVDSIYGKVIEMKVLLEDIYAKRAHQGKSGFENSDAKQEELSAGDSEVSDSV